MIACPSCGFEASDDFAFCPKCATPLAAPPPIAEERKVVTTLFCDLVAFTAMSEAVDPEDVDTLLGEYFARATKAIESHGGTVEKFIGDAVVGVFGVPTVHEDDPERAVRAGLRIVEALEGMARPDRSPLQARIGINTGEALVRLDVDPSSGKGFLTGDAVNTAARLEAAAPPMGVCVGALTHELTERTIVYEPLEAVVAKGKSEPLAAWRALRPLATASADPDLAQLTPLIGRDVELAFLQALLKKAVSSSTPQFVVLLGEPGIGKSRLVQELRAVVQARPEAVVWRQGHCLPYGEDVTFWALGEIVKAHAGILESDGREVVEGKLDAVVPAGEDRAWLRNRLRALLGLEAPSARREENFTAWLRFLEEVAANDPTVVVFEDLHWADDALLAFVEHLATRATGVPLLVIATARPELLEKHAAFAAASANVNRLSVDPLSADETQRMVSGLLGDGATLGDTVADIVASCEGNPFFAEQSARLVADRAQRAPVPASVQAVLAARLDALPSAHKALLGDAAVVGGVFWDGALVAVGQRDPDEVDAALEDLIGRHLVRRLRHSSMVGEHEYAFAHALAREVAYQELPRAARAEKHAGVAGWIERKAGDRVEDLAEILAHHYATAVDLAGATGDRELADSLLEPTVRALTLAGDRAWLLDVAAAERHYARALGIAGPDSAARSRLLVSWARALMELGRRSDAAVAFEEAITRLRAEGDVCAAAEAQMGLAGATPDVEGDDTVLGRLADEALEMLAEGPPSGRVVSVMADWLSLQRVDVDPRRLLEVADRAATLSAELGLPLDPLVAANRGCARCDLGDAGAADDFRQALKICRMAGQSEHAGKAYSIVASFIYLCEGWVTMLAVAREGLSFAQRRGDILTEMQCRVMICWAAEGAGEWEAAIRETVALEPLVHAAGDLWHRISIRAIRALILLEMGRAEEAADVVDWLEENGLAEGLWTNAVTCLALAAAQAAFGDSGRAVLHLADSAESFLDTGGYWMAGYLPRAVRLSLALDARDLATSLAASFGPLQPLAQLAIVVAQALLSEARGEYGAAAAGFADAAARWHDFADVYEEAQALLGQGRCLMALGRAPEAAPILEQARAIFARLGAKPALAETEEWLGRAASPA